MLTDKQLMCGSLTKRETRNAVCRLLTNWCRLDTSFSTDIDRSPTWTRSERGVGCVEPRIGAGVQLLAQHVRMHVRRFRQPFTNRQHACADLIFNLIANMKPILFHFEYYAGSAFIHLRHIRRTAKASKLCGFCSYVETCL